ncbi:MAG TPA: AMP-binding protein [Rubrobacteraceae bacterium]|nr:AMP-binding protein [Rubrobacteraceae bacterium]
MVWKSGYEAVEVGGTTLHRMIAEVAAELEDKPALIDGSTGLQVTYATLASRVERVAAGLAARNFGVGDVLALWAPNIPQWAGVALGAMAVGGVVTGINPGYTEGELKGQLTDSGASILATIPPLVPAALSAAISSGVREVIALGEAEGATSILELIEIGDAVPEVGLDAEAVALLPYSSGTTGLPKGVMLTHANLVTMVRQLRCMLRVGEGDTTLAVVPFFHIMGFMVNLALPLASGATVVTMPRFDVGQFLTSIQRHRATFIAVPPPIMTILAHHPMVDAFDLSSLDLIISGGAPLGPDLQQAVGARFPSAAVGQGWGMTETTVGVAGTDRRLGTVPGSVGRIMPNTELRVLDPQTGDDLGVGERGELWARGPQVMAGYLNRPEATAENIDADGWLRTGDLGYVDEDGNVFIVDRLKELIKVNAYQVAPAELEALLSTHPQVADVAVIGRYDASYGQVPVAVVVRRGEVGSDDLMAWVAERAAPHKRIRAIRFVKAIPKTPSGKLLRRMLVEQDRQTA